MEDPTPDSAAGWISSQDTHHGGRDATPSVDISIAQESTAQRVPSNGIELQHVSAQPMLVQSNPLTASSSSLYLEDTVPHVLGASTETTAEYVYTDEEFSKLGIKEVIPRNLLVTVEGKESSINSINNLSLIHI